MNHPAWRSDLVHWQKIAIDACYRSLPDRYKAAYDVWIDEAHNRSSMFTVWEASNLVQGVFDYVESQLERVP